MNDLTAMNNPKLNQPASTRQTTKQLFQRKRESAEELRSSLSSKEQRLRQNYIINRDHAYTFMQGQFDQIAQKPEFMRFISLKRSPQTKNQIHIAKQIARSHEGKRRTQNRDRLRQRILFQKMRRPEHNSPMKHIIKEQDNESTRSSDEKDKPKTVKNVRAYNKYVESDADNEMMLKQLVTRMQDSKGKTMMSDPYTSRKHKVYYVTQTVKGYKDRESLIRDHLFNSIYFLELLSKHNNTQDFQEGKPINLPQHPRFKGKITVVFDLDQTLVHCFEELEQKHQVEIPVTFPGGHSMLAPVNIRPYAKQLLQDLSKDFELMVFTASHEAYANAVINYLDPQKQLIQHRLFRRHCDYIDQGYYIKDLRILGRNLARVVMVDNAAYSYAFQVNNGVPIVSYYEGDKDYELKALKDYLFELKDCKDVRAYNEKTFKLQKYVAYTSVDDLVEDLYVDK